MDDPAQRITEYLTAGGLFNPEYMNHDAVRDLLIDCRDRIEALEAALREAYKDCLNAVEKVKSDPLTELGVHHKGKWGDTTARDWMVAFAEDVEREIKARAALGEKKDEG